MLTVKVNFKMESSEKKLHLCTFLCIVVGICLQHLHLAMGDDTKHTQPTDDDVASKKTGITFTIELFMVVDNAVYRWWNGLAESDDPDVREMETEKMINQYYAYVYKGIKDRFQSVINTAFDIDVSFVGLVINKTAGWTDDAKQAQTTEILRDMVDSRESLHNFLGWVNETDVAADHIMLFTGYNLTYGQSPRSEGLTFQSSICTPFSVSVVEDPFDYRVIGVAVRELAHSLGVTNDQDRNFCLDDWLYIMTPYFQFPNEKSAQNLWQFSPCSVDQLETIFEDPTSETVRCLLDEFDGDNVDDLKPLLRDLPGMTYSADDQCQNSHGVSSYVCRGETEDYSSICRGMPCFVPKDSACYTILPADGTPCGRMKHCLNGVCSPSALASDVLDNCPFGDSLALVDGSPCRMLIQNTTAECYNDTSRLSCCKSCDNIYTSIEGCEFGNHDISSAGCSWNDCPSYSKVRRQVTCCWTCATNHTPFSIPVSPLLPTTSNVTASNASTTSTTSTVTPVNESNTSPDINETGTSTTMNSTSTVTPTFVTNSLSTSTSHTLVNSTGGITETSEESNTREAARTTERPLQTETKSLVPTTQFANRTASSTSHVYTIFTSTITSESADTPKVTAHTDTAVYPGSSRQTTNVKTTPFSVATDTVTSTTRGTDVTRTTVSETTSAWKSETSVATSVSSLSIPTSTTTMPPITSRMTTFSVWSTGEPTLESEDSDSSSSSESSSSSDDGHNSWWRWKRRYKYKYRNAWSFCRSLQESRSNMERETVKVNNKRMKQELKAKQKRMTIKLNALLKLISKLP